MFIEKPISEDWHQYCCFTKAVIGTSELSNKEIQEGTDRSADVSVNFSHRISIEARGKIKIHIEAQLIKQNIDTEIWSSPIPSDGIELIVTSKNADLLINATSNHRKDLVASNLRNGAYRWELNYGMFPHQSVIFWWQVKKETKTS